MKPHFILIIVIIAFSCSKNKKQPILNKTESKTEKFILKPEFQSFIDSSNVIGSILIYDLQKNAYYSNDFDWANIGKLPASTFKIANSIIGLETNVIESDSTIFKWDGEKKWLKKWEQDLVLRNAFHFSCVPCYQEVAKKIGEKRMNDFLKKLDYGNMKVDSTNIDNFWLEGESQISQMQQINFLKRLYKSKLPISKRTELIMKNMMIAKEKDQYRLSGKTGLSNSNDVYNGWYVGYLEVENNMYFFATNIEPKEQFDFDTFVKTRIDLTFEALGEMNIMHPF